MNKSETKPRAARKPRPLLDGAMLRLLMLFGLFFAVIYAMLVARKPETWEKLGFGKVAAAQDQDAENGKGNGGQTGKQAKRDPNDQKSRPTDENEDPVISPDDPVIQGTVQDPVGQPQDPVDDRPIQVRLEALESEVAAVEKDFWRQVYDRLNPVQRRVLYSFIRFAEGKITADSAAIETYQQLVDALATLRKNYENKLLQHVASLPADKNDEKKIWKDVLYDVQQNWQKRLLPGLKGRLDNREPTEKIRIAIAEVRSQIKAQAMRSVRDGTSISRPRDAIAWLMTLEELGELEVPKGVRQVTQVELSSQPMTYRGKWVKVKGRVRSAKYWQLKDHELGLDALYVLFVKSEESSTLPICIVTRRLPEQFPAVERQFVELDEPIEVSGQFFKVRSYQANGGWRECPMVLCDQPEWFPNEKLSVSEPFTMPSVPIMIGVTVLIAILAAGIAIWIYRSTHVPREESDEENSKVSNELGVLQKAEIETVSDRLRKMSESS